MKKKTIIFILLIISSVCFSQGLLRDDLKISVYCGNKKKIYKNVTNLQQSPNCVQFESEEKLVVCCGCFYIEVEE